uniref:Uncharacterized protein n=1 Tax=viral metagenome TaxID=1070528 RepID=A0A6M3LE54_9ZZZZ
MAKQTTKQTQTVKAEETKAEKFYRLASKRLAKALKDISLIGHLASSQYEHTPEQTEYIVNALTRAVENVSDKLNKVKAEKPTVDLPK